MKAIAEIAKTTSVVLKENTLIDIKIQVELTVTLATYFDYSLQQKHPNGVDSLQRIKQNSDNF